METCLRNRRGAIVPGLLLAKDTAGPSGDAGSGLDRKTLGSPLEGEFGVHCELPGNLKWKSQLTWIRPMLLTTRQHQWR